MQPQTFVDLHSHGANHATVFRNRCRCDNDRCPCGLRLSRAKRNRNSATELASMRRKPAQSTPGNFGFNNM
jgi:hypothetical protein